jgi:putative two-component system response regulator
VALSHHERWDGRGYPEGRAGEDIPLSGRIVAIVDCFDALTMDRCYRPAFDDAQALRMLQAERGQAFDPRIVDAFVAAAPAMCELRDRINADRPTLDNLSGEAFQLSGLQEALA